MDVKERQDVDMQSQPQDAPTDLPKQSINEPWLPCPAKDTGLERPFLYTRLASLPSGHTESPMPNRLSRAALGLLLTPVVLLAQSPQPRPTFQSGIQTIEVDVLVTDSKGNSVRGLTKEDFALLEDGTPQTVSQFSFMDVPIQSPEARGAAAHAVDADVATNTGEGRTYVLLISLVERQDPQKTRQLARRFVEEALGPNDQAAVVHVLDIMSKAQGFTRNRSLILASIDRADASVFTGDPTYFSFQLLEDVSERLGRISSRRKAVVWFNAPAFFAPEGTVGVPSNPIDSQRWFAMRDALRAANRNNVAIYPIGTGMSANIGGLDA